MMNRRHCLTSFAALTAILAMPVPKAPAAPTANGRSLVIVYSRTGETATIARFIAETLGADIIRIEPCEPYAEAYSDMTDIAREEKRTGKRREIKPVSLNLEGIDRIFIGSPVWWGGLSTPMRTFLTDHPLDGMAVHTFHTSGSSSASASRREAEALCPKARFRGIPFLSTGGNASSAKADVQAWLKTLG